MQTEHAHQATGRKGPLATVAFGRPSGRLRRTAHHVAAQQAGVGEIPAIRDKGGVGRVLDVALLRPGGPSLSPFRSHGLPSHPGYCTPALAVARLRATSSPLATMESLVLFHYKG